MTTEFKNILNQATTLEKGLAYNKEAKSWPWPELIKGDKFKKINLADFLVGFSDLKYLRYQGVEVKLANDRDHKTIAQLFELSGVYYNKIELIQFINSKSNIIVSIPDNVNINIDYKNNIFSTGASIYFLIGHNSKVTIIDHHQTKNNFGLGAVYLISGSNTQVEYLSLVGNNSYNFNLRSYPGKFSAHHLYAIGQMTEKYYYYNIMSFLAKEGSQNYILSSLNFLNNAKSIIKFQNNHIAKKTIGDIKFKGIGWDNSKSKVDGLIEIYKTAKDTVSYLKEDIILASDNSYIKAEPNLEILNYDVKASHGATIGYMDQKALFYLRSRGLSKVKAEKLIATGFLKSLAKDIINPDLKNKFTKYFA